MIHTHVSKWAFGALGLAVLVPLSAYASNINNVMITQQKFDSSGNYIVDFLGGDGSIGLGVDLNQQRRLALNSIPSNYEWAYWDPSGLGDDFDFGDGNAFSYHDGRQIQWGSKFSTSSVDGQVPPNGTITPANLDSLGARWNLDTGAEVAQSGQGSIRIQDSGKVGLRIDPTEAGGVVDGQKFSLRMTIPVGEYRVSLFQENKTLNTPMSINFPGVGQIDVPAINGGNDEYALQFDVLNDSAGSQELVYEIGDLNANDNLTDIDIRFSAAVIQSLPVVPEPGSLALGLLAALLLGGCRRNV